jgi:hypothetical protein
VHDREVGLEGEPASLGDDDAGGEEQEDDAGGDAEACTGADPGEGRGEVEARPPVRTRMAGRMKMLPKNAPERPSDPSSAKSRSAWTREELMAMKPTMEVAQAASMAEPRELMVCSAAWTGGRPSERLVWKWEMYWME